MGDRGHKDKAGRESKKKAIHSLKEKRRMKTERKTRSDFD
uniref:Ubiquitin specific proteinase, putative n=1 Tax=Rubinisphaera brasiliensis (strain ATCC 49424 / DSM 5305 / JCM 21570 / IAM 15109 / NBRC 103401 / IFAM 1448) TaxID=756272 RepID=F0SMU2_RUBBR|nr:ubiquitin specific proteinase, putative [Rubinisphaera brasiliensis DSM 5305]